MNIRVNLPDGSVANFPQGTPPDQIQAEIEQFLATRQGQQPAAPERRVLTPGQDISRDVNRLRDTIGRGSGEFQENFDWAGEPSQPQPREILMNAMEQSAQAEAQRRGPPRRNAEISIREAIAQKRQPYQQPTMGATELNTPAMRDAMRGKDAPTSEVNADQGPQRRRAEVSIREALPESATPSDQFEENFDWSGGESKPIDPQPEKAPSEMTDAELRAAEIAANSPVREFVTDAAEAFTGAVRGGGQRVQEYAGQAASALGMPGVGARLLQGAENTAALSERRRQEEADREATSAANAQRFAEERARRTPQQGEATPPIEPSRDAVRPATQADQAARTQTPQMPRAMSVQGAREQQLGAASQAPLSMGEAVRPSDAVKPGPVPKKAMDNAVRTGMDFLIERSDQITLRMLQAGDIRGATAFREFVRGEQAQKGMEYMNRTFAAIQYQDSQTFAESTAKMVQSFDPDGDWEVDASNTKLTQDTQGNPSGAIVTLRNKRTGELSEQVYQGLAEVYDGLSRYGDPQGQFKAAQERIQQAQAQKVENAKNFTSAYDEAAKLLFPDGFVDSLGKMLPQEEMDRADQMIRDYIARSRPDLPQPAPRRAPTPAPQQPGAASGVGASIRGFFGGSTGDQPVPTFGG